MDTDQRLALEEKVESILNDLRPMLGMHNGDVRLLDISAKNVVELEFLGACASCSIADITLNQGLREALLIQCPELTDVVVTNMPDMTQPEKLHGPADSPLAASL
jgi:Fe-S cluster biogenesis protein NfuA